MSFVKRLRLRLSAIVPLLFIALFGMAAPASATDLAGVRMVDYGAGAFVQTGPKAWAEVDKATWKVRFRFTEEFRVPDRIDLADTSRPIMILISDGTIFYVQNGENVTTPLYQIVSTSKTSRIPGSEIAWDGPPAAPTGLTINGGQGATTAAPSLDGYTWKYTRTSKAVFFATAVGVLTLSTPAAVQVSLLCLANEGQVAIGGTFGASVGSLAPGKQVAVEFTGDGFYTKLAAQVMPAQGETAAGVAINAPVGDALWAAMQGRRSLNYKIVGQASTKLPLTKGSGDVAQFFAECANAKPQ